MHLEIKGLFEATIILHDEEHVSVYAEEMKIFCVSTRETISSFFFDMFVSTAQEILLLPLHR